MIQKLQAISNLEHQLFDYKNNQRLSAVYFDDDNVIDEVLKKILIFSTGTYDERKELLKKIEKSIVPINNQYEENAPVKDFLINDEGALDRIIDAYVNNFKVMTFLSNKESQTTKQYELISFEENDMKFKFQNIEDENDKWPTEENN